jgi:hypothetical protein
MHHATLIVLLLGLFLRIYLEKENESRDNVCKRVCYSGRYRLSTENAGHRRHRTPRRFPRNGVRTRARVQVEPALWMRDVRRDQGEGTTVVALGNQTSLLSSGLRVARWLALQH